MSHLFLQALNGESVSRPPVWIMRQAGRYLPDFMKLKAKYDFFTRCQTPELATEITIMPIRQIGPDAAILFSDILVVLQAMNIKVEMKPDVGPWIPNPIRNRATLDKVIVPSALIILFNIKAGRLLFKSPVVGLLSALPTSIFIFRGSLPLVSYINNWIENKINKYDDSEVIDTDSLPLDD